MGKPAVFIDRDGVINIDHGYLNKVDDFEYIDGVFDACRSLKMMGYLLVLITNQSGIARGYYTEDDFLSLTEWMKWEFSNRGVNFDGIYYCPHHPKYGYGMYKKDCDCRKPKPGMLIDASSTLKIDMENSVMIGDKVSDIRAAESVGITTKILVRTGKKVTEEGVSLATIILDSIADVPAYLKVN
ncbi:D-glycero-beta-D-manno-heptose 1,7-bisphosphate 7-phosphatase [Candidatus Enterovibrio escicola]|uniref:D,D-heptose 1,7-bisphosphate phosphatase n=1 Tax=Candidatus Enterovibrio escicola TaxID=1927127 RepID=A0A2A5T0Q3_9GAMM|nr:D-glycero-beta-D-manno-heptose 1,7-bisphosphate 7-phosphatase [Candidatus Enterovibrio escacola]PCS21742.1 D-glycero-D-manno-heptose 1,7-bisphosphate phosphatase [Candidatus Enterovibrio escacola]